MIIAFNGAYARPTTDRPKKNSYSAGGRAKIAANHMKIHKKKREMNSEQIKKIRSIEDIN